jgi:hypothetical protein
MSDPIPPSSTTLKAKAIALWGARILVAIPFLIAAWLEGLSSPADLIAMDLVWIPNAPLWLVRGVAAVEGLAALGLVLPGLVRLPNRIVTVSAGCLLVIQLCALGFDLSRGEVNELAVKLTILGLTIFVLWARKRD